jgi:hypothetical protein
MKLGLGERPEAGSRPTAEARKTVFEIFGLACFVIFAADD